MENTCRMTVKSLLITLAHKYNDQAYFQEDPILFPKHFARLYNSEKASLQDIEISAIISAHLAWGRRNMIVRDCNRALDEMSWKPYDYIMNGKYRDDDKSLHRTIKWCDFANICKNLREFYSLNNSLEYLSPEEIRIKIFSQKSDLNAANKKIHMLRRWMVRDDGKVDIGIWKNISPSDLIIPLDVHVHRSSLSLEMTARNSANYKTALEITEALKSIFPSDPTLGDFALFAYAATEKEAISNI